MGAYLVRPSLYFFVGLALVWFYTPRTDWRSAFFLAFLQVGLTAGYRSQREMTVFTFGGLAFNPVDVFAAVALVLALASIDDMLRHRATRRIFWALVILLAVLAGSVVKTWAMGEDLGQAVRNYRSYIYLFTGVGLASAVIHGLPIAKVITTVNLAAAAAASALLAQAFGWVHVVGFEEQRLVLSFDVLSRLQIVDETLLPVLLGAGLTSALYGKAEVRWTGTASTALLVGAVLTSPGRGAIFSCIVVAGTVALLRLWLGKSRGGAFTPVLGAVVLAGMVLLVVQGSASFLRDEGQNIAVIRARTADALTPWESVDFSGRVVGWTKGWQVGRQQPVLGWGLGHTTPELVQEIGATDYYYNVPGTIPNLFIKTGAVGVLSLLAFVGLVGHAAAQPWRRRIVGPWLVGLPMVVAIVVRSLSDDVLGSVGVSLSLGVVMAMVAGIEARQPMASRSLGLSTIK